MLSSQNNMKTGENCYVHGSIVAAESYILKGKLSNVTRICEKKPPITFKEKLKTKSSKAYKKTYKNVQNNRTKVANKQIK